MAISVKQAKRYCKEKLSNIENYDKAVHDDTQLWVCHHRDEVKVLPSGMVVFRSLEELKENGRYYKCPANELIFLTIKDHNTLHRTNKEIGEKISNSKRGKKPSLETRNKMSMKRKGVKPKCSMIGKKHSDETKQKMKNIKHKNSKFYNEFGMTFEEYKILNKMRESVSTIRRMYKNGGL